MMFADLFEPLIEFLIPPRPSERIVRQLTLSTLRSLMRDESLPYHDPRVTALVWELKYYGNAQAARLCGALLSEQLLAIAAEELGAPLVIPVPMHPTRRRERGRNHTELLCKAALKSLSSELEYVPRALVRTIDTPTQQGLPRAKRLTNVQGSMRASSVVTGRACIVIDDVSTTGATLAEAKRALREAGARVIHTVPLAH